jgi:glycosyltransferase involved in cell wall biosynthesis
MSPVTAMVVGPEEHGVVRHATMIAEAVDARIERHLDLSTVAGGPADTRVCHWHFTDRLFGASIEDATASFVDALAAISAPHVVTLHDVPAPTGSSRSARRVDGYRKVAEAADRLVVASTHERARLRRAGISAPVLVIPLPIVPAARPTLRRRATRRRSVAVLGFVYPGKGHAEVIAAVRPLPPDVQIVALGRPSDGHQPLVDCLRRTATSIDRRLLVTGFLDDVTLADALHHIDVPVVPARSVSASASTATWIAAGRRPLVARNAYTTELAGYDADLVTLYDPEDLTSAIAQAIDAPSSTRRRGPIPPPLQLSAVAEAHCELYRRTAR